MKNTLSGQLVGRAMRRLVIRLRRDVSIGDSVNALIKYKMNALLAVDEGGQPIGVLSKTDIMGAYYAGLPIDSELADIISVPPLYCSPHDTLEEALGVMRKAGVYRLYVVDPETRQVIGALAYPDIVGLLYRFCHRCERSHYRRRQCAEADPVGRFVVGEIMTTDVKTVFRSQPLAGVMEALSAYRFGALLVTDPDGTPCGVISKTDLALAYKHGVDSGAPAETVMSSPVQSCNASELLETAIRKMIFSDLHRLFVHRSGAAGLVGVISLSDAARIRSGSCHACVSSRIKI